MFCWMIWLLEGCVEAEEEAYEAVEAMLSYGADANCLNAYGKTPLTSCIESAGHDGDECNLDALEVLVEAGADEELSAVEEKYYSFLEGIMRC